jgi:hypothetical protein
MNQELRLMDLLLSIGNEDRLFLYSESLDRDGAVKWGTLIAALTSQVSAMKYIFAPVESIAALKTINTTSQALWPDNWVIHVKGKGLYALDRASTAEADDNTVVAANGPGRWIGNGSTPGAADYVSKANGGTFGNDITVNGYVTATNFISGSDERFKEYIEPMNEHVNSLALLRRVEFKRYKWKNSETTGYGVIAQQLKQLAPDLVHEREDRLFVDIYAFMGIIGSAVQQLANEVETLKGKPLE